MSEDNIYASPTSDPETSDPMNSPSPLASRWSRLGASLLDTLIMIVILIPLMFLTGYFDKFTALTEPSYFDGLLYSLLGIVFFMIINFKFLLSQGQTIGKKVVGIRITGLGGEKIDVPIIAKRYGFYFLVGQIPIIGGIISLVNVLFIFGQDKRCLHDLVAGTKVVKCN